MNTPKWDDTEPVSWDDTEPVEDVPSFDDTQEIEAPKEAPGKLESAFRGGIDFASGGFSDELGGAIEAAGSVVGLRGLGENELQMPRGETPEEKKQSLLEVYKAMRDKRRGINKEALKASPKSYMAGGLAGGLASGAAMKVAGATGSALTGLGKLPGWIANTGAGGLFGLGQSEAEDVEGLAKDTATGAATGFGMGALFSGAGKVANSTAQGSKKVAEKNAVDSLAPMLADEKAMANQGVRDKLGREILDGGVTKFGSSPGKQAERLGPLLEEKGKRLGAIRDSVDKQASKFAKAGDNVAADARRVDFDTALAKRAERAAKASKGGTDLEKSYVKSLDKNVASMSEVPSRSLKDTSEAIQKMDKKQIPWKKAEADWTPEQQAVAEIRRNLAKQMDGKIRGFTKDFDEYTDTKEMFGLFKRGEELANTATMKGRGGLVPGLKDMVTASAATKDGMKAIPGMFAAKIVRDRGHAMIAKTADVAYKTLSTSPEVLGKYNGPLMRAMKKGEKAFLATHAALINTDPEYKQLVESMDTGDEG